MKKIFAFTVVLIGTFLPSLGYPKNGYSKMEGDTIKMFIFKKIYMAEEIYKYKITKALVDLPYDVKMKAILDSTIYKKMPTDQFSKTFDQHLISESFTPEFYDCVLKDQSESMDLYFKASLKHKSFKTQFEPYYDAILNNQALKDSQFITLFAFYDQYTKILSRTGEYLFSQTCARKYASKNQIAKSHSNIKKMLSSIVQYTVPWVKSQVKDLRSYGYSSTDSYFYAILNRLDLINAQAITLYKDINTALELIPEPLKKGIDFINTYFYSIRNQLDNVMNIVYDQDNGVYYNELFETYNYGEQNEFMDTLKSLKKDIDSLDTPYFTDPFGQVSLMRDFDTVFKQKAQDWIKGLDRG